MDKLYLKDYFKQPIDERKAYKAWNNEPDEKKKKKLYKKLLKIRGIYTVTTEDKHGNKTTEYKISERLFTKYILSCFFTVFISGSVMFYNWKKHKYEYLGEQYYLAMFKQLIDDRMETLWNSNTEKLYHSRFLRDIPIKLKEWHIPVDYIVFENGCFKISTGEFFEGDHPEVIINMCCTGYSYDADATCVNFKAFLENVFNGDKDLIAVAQEMAGYTLMYGANPLQVITLLIGSGRNGKGVFANIISKVNGEENVSAVPVQKFNDRFSLSGLSSKVLNISSENEEAVSMNTSVIKSLSGNDILMTERKFKDSIPERLFCKLWISTNDIVFSDTSIGIEERLVPLVFKNTYVNNPVPGTNQRARDNDLESKLSHELAGIFNFCYEGLVRLRNNNWKITDSEEVRKQRQFLVEASNPVRLFMRTMIVPKEGEIISKSQVFKKYKDWSTENKVNVGSISSPQKFYPKFEAELDSRGMAKKIKRIKGINYYSDFELNSRMHIW